MNENKLAVQNSEVYSQVLSRVNQYRADGELALPQGYSAENAIKTAQLIISEITDRNKRSALEVCTKASVAQALLDTVLQGLNPGKKQCYYIVYGNKLTMQRSRYGEEHLAKSVCPDIEGIYPDVVYDGDVFEYSKHRGRTVVEQHRQSIANVNPEKMIAAYCTIMYRDGREETTVMTMDEIYASWRKSKQSPFDSSGKLYPNSTHGQYKAEMAKRTVVRRACKPIINSSDDSNLLFQNSIRRTDNASVDAETDAIIYESSGSQEIDITEPPTVDETTGEVLESPTASTPY